MDESVTVAARVQRYGLLAPVLGADLVYTQMRAGARYYNDLIALERSRRTVYRELRSAAAPELAELEQRVESLASELEQLRDRLKSARKDARGRVIDRDAESRARSVRADLTAARGALKVARKRCAENAALRDSATALEERANRWHKALRATTDAYWGSYLLEEQSVEQARKALVDPGFRRARGRERVRERAPGDASGPAEGRIGVQIQGGMTPAELYACEDTRARIEPVSDWGPWAGTYDVKRRPAFARLWLRVGSEGRAPVWAIFPLNLHRPIPDDARIKTITVRLRLIGTREEWSASVTYTREAVPMPQRGGAVAFDLGWRKRPDGSLRAAYWVNDAGAHGELTTSSAIRGELRKASGLREIQDIAFNRATRWLALWLRAAEGAGISLPVWLRAECAQLGQWRSHARLRRLIARWRKARFARDERIYAPLERWLHRSRHLYEWESEARENALLRRRDAYRCHAAAIARRYGVVVLERFDLRKAKQLHAPEQQSEDAPLVQRAQLHQASPGALRTAIKQAVEREGGLVVELDASGTTSHCHACGAECVWDQAEELHHRCEHCGAVWDQDHNAAINLLQLWQRERSGDSESTAGARKPANRAPRFAKRHARPRVEGPAAE